MITPKTGLALVKTSLAIAITLVLSGCGSDSDKNQPVVETSIPDETSTPVPVEKFSIGLLPDTQGGTDTEGQSHVAIYPMQNVLKQQANVGVDMVIALGDLTDGGSELEFAEWTSVAQEYKDQGIEFLPVMGNHESSYAYTVNWIDNMKNFIPEDAVHMPGFEWLNYYVVRDNVLIFGLAYYNLPVAFQWIKDTVLAKEDGIDHIVVASHDGLIGAKYGQTLEHIVDGTKDDNWVYDVQPQIRQFFSDQDVIYVQGHEHQYQRSLIAARKALETFPSSATPTGGNYRMGAYTQIMAGNASYKGYEFRYGERELVQMIVSQKNGTYSEGNGSDHYDVNSAILTFEGQQVDYEAYYAEHQAKNNDAQYDFNADWKLMDKFSRSTNRCETIIYANSILYDTRPVLVFQTDYLSNDCYGDDGSFARLVGGTNNSFNRTDSRTRDFSYTPGFSRAETLNDLTRLAYQWLYVSHENWTPNLNSPNRVVPDPDTNELLVPETSIDLKEHVTLSWLPANDTQSDILIVSGTQNQTGMYQNAYGGDKDITQDTALVGSQTDGGAKAAVSLPTTATRKWDISDAVSDSYTVLFTGDKDTAPNTLNLAHETADGWQPIVSAECIVTLPWSDDIFTTTPERPEACAGEPLVGLDSDYGNRWWVILNEDTQLALITR
jgi:hypothetical protein